MAMTRHENSLIENSAGPSSRAEVLARYRRLREISKQHHHEILDFVSGDLFLHQARRLGLARGKTLILDDLDEMNYVHDLVIHTPPAPRRSRAIDRYAGAVKLKAGSDEARVLDAMRAARFAVLSIERHPAAGLIASDLFRGDEIWLVDIGLESSAPEGDVMATRLYTPESFSMTAGIPVPFDLEMVSDIQAELPRLLGGKTLDAFVDEPRFAEMVYRVALAGGIMDRVRYQEVPAA